MKDGGVWNNVEFWSGGFQLFGAKHCGMQRIISLEAERFKKSLIYHTSNNKQFTIGKERMVDVEGMYQQLAAFGKKHVSM